jgi:hypothetical protein
MGRGYGVCDLAVWVHMVPMAISRSAAKAFLQGLRNRFAKLSRYTKVF